MSPQELIFNILKEAEALPFLFVGSGMSRRYLDAESWENLLRLFAHKVDTTPFYFEKLRNQAKLDLEQKGIDSGNTSALFPRIADLIDEALSKVWYDQPQFEETRTSHANEIAAGVSPLKIEISDYCKKLLEKQPLLENEVRLLKELSSNSIAGIITTNYDCFLETLFPDFYPYIGQETLVFSNYQSISEIYKVHGCCNEPASIIINSKDYAEFDKRYAYLAAKLLTIFVEHPIIFLGYSIQDDDIKKILESIIDCLSVEKLSKLTNRLIFVERKDTAGPMDISSLVRDFGGGKSIEMTRIMISDYSELYETLLQIKSKYPTKILRRIKNDIYNLTLTTDPAARLVAINMTDDAPEDQVEYVFGIGALEIGRTGYSGVTVDRLYRDIVFDDETSFIYKFIVEDTIPALISRCGGFKNVPAFKYLSRYDQPLPEKLNVFMEMRFSDYSTNSLRKLRRTSPYHSVNEIHQSPHLSLSSKLSHIAALSKEDINKDELRDFLIYLFEIYPDILTRDNLKSPAKKLIRIYDYLMYKD